MNENEIHPVEAVPPAASALARSRRRHTVAGGLLVAALATGCAWVTAATLPRRFVPPPLPATGGAPTGLADVLARAIEAEGIDGAAALYRTLRAGGFPGVVESESATNRLGYQLLRQGDPRAAIQILALNAETHPESANVHDSLGEAYLAAGDKASAVASYEKAVAIAPRSKSAGVALQRLTGREREPFPPLLLFHISAGAVGLISGAAAGALRKGSRRHGIAGKVFVGAMLAMSSSGAYLASRPPEPSVISVLMGILTFYLVATAWWTARRRELGTGPFDWIALLVVWIVAAELLTYGWSAAGTESGALQGIPAAIFFVFGGVALLAGALDLRRLALGGLVGGPRIARHLWRMCTALYIATTSFFQGQPQIFPVTLRNSGLLVLPGLLVLALLLFWLIRVRYAKRWQGAVASRPAPETVRRAA
jgi:hypothetical protein